MERSFVYLYLQCRRCYNLK